MPERIKKILDKIVEWWKKFTRKQQIMLVGITLSVILALTILVVVLTRPKMVVLVTAESIKEANSIKELLDSDTSIDYTISEDGLTFKVRDEDKTTARYLLGVNKIQSDAYTIEDVTNRSFTTTESDMTKKHAYYLEQQLKKDLEGFDNIEEATVNLHIPVDDGTILARNQITFASVKLKLSKPLEEGQAEGIAKFVATAVGDSTTEGVTILDYQSNVLFAGGDENTTAGTLSKQASAKSSQEAFIKNQIKAVMLGTKVFENVEVALNLNMDWTSKTITDTVYSVAEGREEGYLTNESAYNEESTGGYAGVPGTDSNDSDTTYVIQDGNNTSTTISDITKNYALNSKITETVDLGGTINYSSSTVSLVAISYKYYDEDVLKSTGQLDGITFDEFKENHNETVQLEVSDEYYDMIANATGFAKANITIIAYEVPCFNYSAGPTRTVMDYIEIALAVIIFLLLGFVVFKATRPVKEEELEPELSVETLLESTKAAEDQLEDIGYTEKSQTRILIEKFVEENPEAAAALLRNWLEEDWN
ncbi:MAG: flagellar biosynthesis protein [Lachnospiraceae bacterium]|nr:flagellar biosynthesis protein [Lachnospiraceae bacterium]MBR0434646.1 flagellar biosynthesis protein [Lachnospiraceae bacterium]